MRKSKKLKSIVTSGVLLIPAVLVLSSATKSNAMLGAMANKVRPLLKAPGITTRLPKLNNMGGAIKRPHQGVRPMVSTPTSSTGSRSNSTLVSRVNSSIRLGNFETGVYGTTVNTTPPTQKRPPYNPNKGPAPKPPTLQSVYETPDPVYQNQGLLARKNTLVYQNVSNTKNEPIYQNISGKNEPVYQNVGSTNLARRPLPPLPQGAKNLGTMRKVLIKDGQVVQNQHHIYENIH